MSIEATRLLDAAKQALEALEECRRDPRLKYEHPTLDKAITSLRQAIAEAEKQEQGEPDKYVMDIECTKCGAKQSGVLTVNTTPQQRTWVGLTDDDWDEVLEDFPHIPDINDYSKIEAKLKEKNT